MGSFEAIVFCVIAACFLAPAAVETKAVRKIRDTKNICSAHTPCGWEVYRPFMRNIEYFISNTCDCQDGTHCVRASDDISISAYVFLCRPEN